MEKKKFLKKLGHLFKHCIKNKGPNILIEEKVEKKNSRIFYFLKFVKIYENGEKKNF